MMPSRLLFVGRYHTTVSSYPHPPVHNFRPYRHQPVDLEICGRLAGDVGHDGAKTLSYKIAQFLQLFQPVYLFVTEHLVHAPLSTVRVSTNTLFPAALATHTAIPTTSQNHRIHCTYTTPSHNVSPLIRTQISARHICTGVREWLWHSKCHNTPAAGG
jgi:hypothetical protein